MKEAFRLSAKELLEDIVDYDFVFVYFGSDKVDFVKIEESMKSLLLSFRKRYCLEKFILTHFFLFLFEMYSQFNIEHSYILILMFIVLQKQKQQGSRNFFLQTQKKMY
ncbi:MAG: hypothetical protein CM15mP121_3320 [Bacteroidota bacterium]|nr:MAG: hypothetical protein CM15mP121_3320 [Bacteroidota bacterium]